MPRLHASLAARLITLVALTAAAVAQPQSASEPTDAKTSKSRWRAVATATAGYDSNVFRLSDRSRDRLELDRPADAVSERFRDMSSVDDFVLDVDLTMTRRGTGLDGRDLDLAIGLGADLHATNSIKNSPHITIEAIQDLAKGGELRAQLGYEHGRFRRNYLYDATDLTGNVSASERVYRSGKFNELGTTAEYRVRLWRERKKKAPNSFLRRLGLRQLDCRLAIGAAQREYNHFANRDRNMLHGKLTMISRIGKRWRLHLSYLGRYVDTPGDSEVLVLDETDFGVDFNNDGDALDQNRRTRQRVDRDRMDHRLAAELRWQLAKKWESRLGYEFMQQDYFSNAPFDLNNNGRTDTRHLVTGRLEYQVAKRTSAELRLSWMDEQSDRLIIGDEDEESSYGRWQAFLTMSIRF